MTASMDPWELNASPTTEEYTAFSDAVDEALESFKLGAACDITDTDCEACQ